MQGIDDLVKVKGLKGKQNKKKWAKNIDVSGLLESMEKQSTLEWREKFATPLVVEETTGVRVPLDPNRFKSKGQTLPKKKYDNKPKAQSVLDEPFEDLWAQPTNNQNRKPLATVSQQPLVHKYQPTQIPAVIKPVSGHSYNPNPEAVNQLIENVLDYEGSKVKKTKPIKKKQFKEQQIRHRNKNVRAQQLEIRERKANKQLSHELHSHRKIAKEVDQKIEEIETRIQERESTKQQRQKEAQSGRVRYGKKIGKTQYKFKEHIPQTDEYNKKLSHVGGSEALVKDRFDSIYRRGIFEPRNIKVHANKKKHIKVKERQRDETN